MRSRDVLVNLREQYPDQQIWVGDETAMPVNEFIDVQDAFTSLVTIGYETLGERVVPPWKALSDVANDIDIYALCRSLKDPEDAGEGFFKRTHRPYVNEFLRQAFGLVEDFHSRGLHIGRLTEKIEAEVPDFITTANNIHKRMTDEISKSAFIKTVWQEVLIRSIKSDK